MTTFVLISGSTASAADQNFNEKVLPVLEDRCFSCHGNGINKGGVDLEGASESDTKLWWSVLKNIRSGLMPPEGEPRPSLDELKTVEVWIKAAALGIDPADLDCGRTTVRRLNRIEYRNTVRDLIGVDFDTAIEFPADDSGHGFDNNGDVLTLSPLQLEKYLDAAKAIIAEAVPIVDKVIAERTIPGSSFRRRGKDDESKGPVSLPYHEKGEAHGTIKVEHDGRYKLVVNLNATEKYVEGQSDVTRCMVIVRDGDEVLLRREFAREEGKRRHFDFDRDWKAGDHDLVVEIDPLTPDEKPVRERAVRIQGVTLKGPLDEKFWVHPPRYEQFFPDAIPQDEAERRTYARKLLLNFASKAFRRPAEESTGDRLLALAEAVWQAKGQTFEAGIAQAMTAVLASPRFIFREEDVEPDATGRYPQVDEYSLASRLSYFLWSSMPDEELLDLARQKKLRERLDDQVKRMLADSRSSQLIRNFVGQWLQVRDIETVIINAQAVITRDEPVDPEADRKRARMRELFRKSAEELTEAEKVELKEARAAFPRGFGRFRQFELNGDLRRDMRRESEMLFEHILREDRPLVELLDSDYAFLNERLAKHYGIEDVKGDEIRKVKLPDGSPRGGVLTQGTILAVTSNPDRTSPVKRGLFILDNILGSPPAPPPPNIPSLEEAGKKASGKTLTLRESMVLHRSDASCASCHSRMDPLGLALENFNALGRFRDKERAGPIDASGKLLSGESFQDIREVKQILVEKHRTEFYRCLTEKLLTYALGRGLEAYDVGTVDAIVDRIEKENGKPSAMLKGIIESAPFQRRRRLTDQNTTVQAGASNPS